MKRLITDYKFNAAGKTVTFTRIPIINPDGLLLITNVTDNVMIFNFADSTLTGVVDANVVTLAYNTTSMSNTDRLQIWYDDGIPQATDVSGEVDRVAGRVTDKEVLDVLTKISEDLEELKTYILEA
jgi:hypothetical protein